MNTDFIADNQNMPFGSGKFVIACFCALLVQVAVVAQAFGATAEVDTSFGENGVVKAFPSGGNTVIFQRGVPGIAGSMYFSYSKSPIGGAVDSQIIKMTGTGSRDETFGTRGSLKAPDHSELQQRSDGGVIAIGTRLGVLEITDLQPDGSPDPDFGHGNSVDVDLTPFGYTNNVTVFATAVDSSNRILVTLQPQGGPVLILRVDQFGTLDTSFGVGGVVELWSRTSQIGDEPKEVATGPDDGILIVTRGLDTAETKWPLTFIHLLVNGFRDPDFGTQGVLNTPVTIEPFPAVALTYDAAGRIYVAATVNPHAPPDVDGGTLGSGMAPSILRFLADGSLDSSFANEGIFGEYVHRWPIWVPKHLAALPFGGVESLGCYQERGGMIRLTDDGQPDLSFSSGGMIIMPPAPPDQSRTCSTNMLQTTSNRFVAYGFWFEEQSPNDQYFEVTQFRTDAADIITEPISAETLARGIPKATVISVRNQGPRRASHLQITINTPRSVRSMKVEGAVTCGHFSPQGRVKSLTCRSLRLSVGKRLRLRLIAPGARGTRVTVVARSNTPDNHSRNNRRQLILR